MGKFEERNLKTVSLRRICEHCVHYVADIDEDDCGYCLLDLTEDDKEYLEDHTLDNTCPKRVCEILQIPEDTDDWLSSPRLVKYNNVCQFFD